MGAVIAFPTAAERGQFAIDRALAEFDTERMMRLAMEHPESEVRSRAAQWLAEMLKVRVVQ